VCLCPESRLAVLKRLELLALVDEHKQAMQPSTCTSPCKVGALISTTLRQTSVLAPVRTTNCKANTPTMRLYTILNTFVLSLTAVSVTALSLPERRSDINASEFTYPPTSLEELMKMTSLTSLCPPTHHLSLSVRIAITISQRSSQIFAT
jgi:hypothetical protein